MCSSPSSPCLGPNCDGRNLLVIPERQDLLRLTGLVGRMFRVPVAYVAMLGHRDRVMSRIGSGEQYWQNVKTYPLEAGLAGPLVVRDAADGLPGGADLGELRFMAAAPLRTLCGQPLGILVIADRFPRPDFSGEDLDLLVDFAYVATISLEARMMASRAAESRLQLEESEERFREVADAAPIPIGCYAADGACIFVNRTWREFTGRSMQEELGDGWSQAIHSAYRETVLDSYWRASQARQRFLVDAPMRRHDGVFRRMRCEGTPRLFADRTSAGFLVSMTEVADWYPPKD